LSTLGKQQTNVQRTISVAVQRNWVAEEDHKNFLEWSKNSTDKD
jgi:hypothetical protein